MTDSNAQRLVNLGVIIGSFSSVAIYGLVYQALWLSLITILGAFYCANEADKILRSM